MTTLPCSPAPSQLQSVLSKLEESCEATEAFKTEKAALDNALEAARSTEARLEASVKELKAEAGANEDRITSLMVRFAAAAAAASFPSCRLKHLS